MEELIFNKFENLISYITGKVKVVFDYTIASDVAY